MRLALGFILAALVGCEPTCEDLCDKIVECGNPGTERMSAFECEESCIDQEQLLETWNDTQLQDAFDAEKACIDDATCDALAEGACYDAELWAYEAR